MFGRYLQFLDVVPEDSLLYVAHHNPALVGLSIVIAVFAAFTSLLVARYAERTDDGRDEAMTMLGDREKAIEAGMDDHIAKPLDVDAMFVTLAKWIKPAAQQAASATVQDTPVALSDLPGIDTRVGLHICMGNEGLYRRLLAMFRDDYGDFAAAFTSARADMDRTAATRCAHTLKGTAGNVGARRVQTASSELEKACKAEAPPDAIAALLDETGAALAEILPALVRLGGGAATVSAISSFAPPAPTAGVAAAPDLGSRLTRLRELIANGDAEAVDVLADLERLATGTPLAVALAATAAAIADYDFDGAMNTMDGAMVQAP